MAKTVDNFSTIEDFRKTYNELAFDVGDISGLRDALKSGNNDTLVDAVNVLEDKQFFFQEFTFIATANQVSFSGADAFGNSLVYKDEKIQVFKNEEHLREDVDYIVSGPTGTGSFSTIVLQGDYASGQSKAMSAGDRLIIYSFTGAFIGTSIAGDVASFFQKSAENTIYNTNSNGVILNGDNSSATTTLESGFTLQLAGKTFAEDDLTLASGKTMSAPTVTDGTASLSSGSLTSAVNGTFSGQVQAEHLKSTDDLEVTDDASIGGELAVTGNTTLTANLNVNGNTTLGNASGDTITFTGYAASSLRPDTNNAYTLGVSSKKWSNVHSTTFTGNLVGNATGNLTGDVLSSGGQSILDSGTNGTDASIRLSTIKSPADGSTTILNVATGLLTGTVSSISNHDTDALSEGSSNLYFTNTRADARVSAVLPNTGSLAEGSNLYFTDERAQDAVGAMFTGNTETGITVTYDDSSNKVNFAVSDTDSITEGSSNLYFTNARADARIAAASISALSDVGSVSGASAGQILAFDSNGDLVVANNSTTTDSTSEGTNKYFTDDRVNDVIVAGDGLAKAYVDDPDGGGDTSLDGRTTLSVNTQNGVKINSDNVELDYSVITDSDLSGGLPSGSGKEIGHLFFLI